MRFFALENSVESTCDRGLSIDTRLGSIHRIYSLGKSLDPFVMSDSIQSNSVTQARLHCWTSPHCYLEELVVRFPYKSSQTLDIVNCIAILLRFEGLFDGVSPVFELSWVPGYSWKQGYPESGEGLQGKTWTDGDSKVSVGTEDLQYLADRSATQSWMPSRLAPHFNFSNQDVIQVGDDFLSVRIPALSKRDRCQLQFIVAESISGDEEDISTFLAIDQSFDVILAHAGCQIDSPNG